MDAGDRFAFLLPVFLLTFSAAFAVVSRFGSKAARSWAAAFGTAGAAHSAPILLQDTPVAFQALSADALFLVAFWLFGQALLDYFGKPRLTLAAAATMAASFAATAYAVVWEESLRAELLLNDLTCAVLILIPLAVVLRAVVRPLDWMLFSLSFLIAIENVVRTVLFNLMALGPDDGFDAYVGSTYAFAMQSMAGLYGIVFAMAALAAEALRVVDHYRREAERDSLTGLLNRRGFERETRNFPLGGDRPASIVVCDIDHFKAVNDAFGHASGDRVLAGFAETMRIVLPADGVAARFGGEEFVLFLPGPPRTAGVISEVLRIAFAERDWTTEGIEGGLTASFGVAAARSGDRSLFDTIARADARLYAAKSGGRNRVIGTPSAATAAGPTPVWSAAA